MRKLLSIVALSLYWLGQGAFANDNDRCSNRVLKQIGKHFDLEHFAFPTEGMYPSVENGGLIAAAACKPWPGDSKRLVAAFAYGSSDGADVNDPFVDLVVAVVNREKDRVVASYRYKYYLDPGGVGSLRIDTAPYHLSSTVRAFGIDIEPGYSHNCGDGGVGAERTLYVQEGKALRPILNIPTMSSWGYIKGNKPGCGPDTDVEIIENIQLAIEVGDSATNGYRDLIVTANSSRTDGKRTGKGKFRYTLHYDGQEYPTQGMEKPFYTWQASGRKP